MVMRLSALAIGLSLALLCGCRKESGPAPVPKADTTAAESPAPPGRRNGILALTLPCGKDSAIFLYDDTSGDDADYVRHRRVDSVFSDSGYFVERAFYEGGDWLYVSKRDCARLGLYGRPIFNPSRARFAAVNADIEAGFEANGVQIVSLESGSPAAKLEDRISEWAPVSGAWADDSTFVADLEDMAGHRSRRTYALRAGAWSIVKAKGAAPADSLPYPDVGGDSG